MALIDRAFLGVHYLPAPSVSLYGVSAGLNEAPNEIPIGASSWRVLDMRGTQVGAGACAPADSTVTVCRRGVWVGGSAAVAGYYTVVTNDGAHGIVTGNVMVCPSKSRLYTPKPEGDVQTAVSAWLGCAADRDFYSYPQIGATRYSKVSDWLRATVAQHRTDPYFAGPQDSARPHKLWIASSTQAVAPKQGPTATEWGTVAAGLRAAGLRGGWYEAPTNEPENGGWSIGATVAYWAQSARRIRAADPGAHVMGYASGGVFNNSPLSAVAAFLAAGPAAFTNHMENSHQNLSNIVALRQYLGALKTQFKASGVPNLDLWLTESGINGGGYGVLHPRRDARQRTVLRFVAESFGWAKENSYDFPIWDHHGSGLSTYIVDSQNGEGVGAIRAGGYALHIMSEALFGTTCRPERPPAALSFGPPNSVGDSLFAGLHYTSATKDVVVLATNGLESATVTLNVSATGPLTCWDGLGVESTLPVENGRVSVPVDDLLTYLFLPAGSTVSVAPSWWSGVTNVVAGLTAINKLGTVATAVTNGSFAENNQGGGVPEAAAPYSDAAVPGTLTMTSPRPARGFVLMTSGPAWQNVGCSLASFDILANGRVVYSYRCESAVTHPYPSVSCGNSSDRTSHTTWWTAPFAWLVETPIPAGRIQLRVNATNFGGQADRVGADVSEQGTPEIQLAEWQLLG